MIYFKEKLKFLESFTSFYLSSASISVFLLIYLALAYIPQSIWEGYNLIIIFCVHLLQLILASILYANRIKNFTQKFIAKVVLTIVVLIFIHKIITFLIGTEGILTTLYSNISLICLFPIGIAYLGANNFNKSSIQRLIIYSILIFFAESILSYIILYVNGLDEQGFYNHIWEHIISYFSYLMAIITYCKSYPLMHPFFVKLNNRFNNIYLFIRGLTFLIGMPTLLLLVIFG
ncbi:hypothetical protein VH441_00485 [Psychrobacter sp. HD31]|uniref:hypothetical protein n=1 Tax=Psychrobacter sp. HD31 TaxID=3112003 RepID=UPI003DA2E3AE